MHRYLIKLTPAQAEEQHQRLADEAAVAVAAVAAAAAARAPPRDPGRTRSAASVTTLASAYFRSRIVQANRQFAKQMYGWDWIIFRTL